MEESAHQEEPDKGAFHQQLSKAADGIAPLSTQTLKPLLL